jgi:UDP-glucose 4-epimerase
MEETSVLVTGGAGFIGSHVASALAPDNEVTILDSNPGDAPPGTTPVKGDVRDEGTVDAALEGIDVVFHHAALVSVASSIERPKESHETNATGTLNVLEAARERDARVVYASSAAVYGQPREVPIPETHRLDPISPYGLTKLASDHYVRLYNDLYGLETVALRYFNVYGPGQTGGDYAGVIEVFLEQARNGEPITVHGDGEQTRDFVHVDDVVRANLLAAEMDAVGRAFNVGTGESVTIRELAELVREAVGSDSEIVHTDPREGDIEHSRADIQRSRRQLGFDPTVELSDGLCTLLPSTRAG